EGVDFRFQTARPAIAAPRSNAPRPRFSARRPSAPIPFAGSVGACVTCDPPAAIHFNSSHTSLAACHLFSGSLARHFLTTRSSAGGVIGWREKIGGGSVSRILAIKLAWVLPS